MKKLSVLLLAAAGVVMAAGPASADTESKVVIKNKSAWAIHELYFSPTDQREWGPDQLGSHTINTGGNYTLTGIPCRAYDVRLVDEDGDECIVEDVAICASNDTWVIEDEDLVGCQVATQGE